MHRTAFLAYSLRLCIGFFLLVTYLEEASAQRVKKLSLKQGKNRKEYTWAHFSNVNKKRFYESASQLKKIAEYKEKKDWRRLQKKLQKYVSKFGIENFYLDVELIWQLAKLTEILDGIDAAKPLYRLVLRHHHEGISVQKIEPYYNSFNQEEIDLYVPLDYYYKLVEHQLYMDTIQAPRSMLLNMGNVINSSKAEYAPFLNIEDNLLLYTSKREKVARYGTLQLNEDIYFATRESNTWQESKSFLDINTQEFNEGSACIDPSGEKLYFSRCNEPEGLGDCDIYVAYHFNDRSWGNVTSLGSAINSRGWDSHPALSASGDTLYFASDRPGGFGLSDIYYSTQNRRGHWTKAKNIGPIINSRNSEVSPFFDSNQQVLYFSSNGQLYNFGGFDIYKSYWNKTHWREPLNIGPLVNGSGSEHYFTIDSNFSHLYYAKSLTEEMQGQDLYSFPLPMQAHPEALVSLTGSTQYKESDEAVKGIVQIIDLDEGVEVAPKFLDKDGTFKFTLIDQRNYLIVVQGEDFIRIEELFYLSGPREIHAEATKKSRKIEFQSLEFSSSSAELNDEMKNDLSQITEFMEKYPAYRLKISGHTDSKGSPEKNLLLSKERSQNIRNFLVLEKGIEDYRVTHEGYGNTQPIVEELTKEDRSINRRVEFFLYYPENNEGIPQE